MSCRKRFCVVATTALVASLPAALPLFADESTAVPSRAAIAEFQKTAPLAPNASSAKLYDADAAFADFDLSLFEIPDGKDAAFYIERVAQIEREWSRRVLEYRERQRKAAQERGESPNKIDPSAAMLTAPLGTLIGGPNGSLVPAPADSVPARRAVALEDLFGRLADDASLPLDVRGAYYQRWREAASRRFRNEGASALEERDFYARLLADEKTKSPLDAGRVRYLSAAVAGCEARRQNDETRQKSFASAEIEKLVDVPQGESSEFYRKRLWELNAAGQFLRSDSSGSKKLLALVLDAFRVAEANLAKAHKKEADEFDRAAAQKILDVPQGQSAEFYLDLYERLQTLGGQVSSYSQYSEYRDLSRLETQIRGETIPELNRRLANADDLEPFERFDRFVAWVGSRVALGDVDALQSALETPSLSEESTAEIDANRTPCLERAILQARLRVVEINAAKARDALAPGLSLLEKQALEQSVPPLASDAAIELREIAAEVAERADDGAIPWELGASWATFAQAFGLQLEKLDPEIAKTFRKDVCATLAHSDGEVAVNVRRELERKIRQAEFVGFRIQPQGRGLNGKPFDWTSLRGAPVLLVSGSVDASYAPQYDREFIPKCVDAGLQIVRYQSDLTSAQNDSQRRLEQKANRARLELQGFSPSSLLDNVSTAAYLVPDEGKTRGVDDWPYEHGIVWTNFAVLFDAEGRVVATSPKLLNDFSAPELGEELRRLFPEIPLSTKTPGAGINR